MLYSNRKRCGDEAVTISENQQAVGTGHKHAMGMWDLEDHTLVQAHQTRTPRHEKIVFNKYISITSVLRPNSEQRQTHAVGEFGHHKHLLGARSRVIPLEH